MSSSYPHLSSSFSQPKNTQPKNSQPKNTQPKNTQFGRIPFREVTNSSSRCLQRDSSKAKQIPRGVGEKSSSASSSPSPPPTHKHAHSLPCSPQMQRKAEKSLDLVYQSIQPSTQPSIKPSRRQYDSLQYDSLQSSGRSSPIRCDSRHASPSRLESRRSLKRPSPTRSDSIQPPR